MAVAEGVPGDPLGHTHFLKDWPNVALEEQGLLPFFSTEAKI